MSSDNPTTKSNVCLFLLENMTHKKREQNKKKIPPILYYIVTSKRNQLETENIVFGAKL